VKATVKSLKWLGLLCAFVSVALVVRADAASVRWLPLVIHVVDEAGTPVADQAFVDERVQRANEIYAPYRVGFVVQQRVPIQAAHARLETRADRDALAVYLQRKVINCFVVASLHWHAATRRGAHYVIISTLGDREVFSHELGHFLGNPEHSPTPGNLMSYERGALPPFLDPDQLTRLERSLRSYLKRGELVLAK
jgi:hypothetical protein